MRDGVGLAVEIGRWLPAVAIGCGLCPILTVAALAGPSPDPPSKAPPAVQERIDLKLRYFFHDCWSWKGRPSADYIPTLRIRFSEDGRVVDDPVLYNPPMGPEQSRLAADVLAHVRGCGALRVTPEMMRFPKAWRERVIRFDTRPDPDGGP